MKAASSNSDLLNDLFAPPAGLAGEAQEHLFFGGAAAPAPKRRTACFVCCTYDLLHIRRYCFTRVSVASPLFAEGLVLVLRHPLV